MTRENQEKIKELLKKAEEWRAIGIDPKIDDGTAWALLRVGSVCMISDGQRFWEHPRLILEFDLFAGDIVTQRYYLRNIPRLPRASIATSEIGNPVAGAGLPQYFKIYETVIFDHTHRDAQGRTWRETIRGDYRVHIDEQEETQK